MSNLGEGEDYSILDENQAARLVILREIAKVTMTTGAMASKGMAYTAGDMMLLCEWVANGMAKLQDALVASLREEGDSDA